MDTVIISVLVILVCVVGWAVGSWLEKKRREALLLVAKENGWQFDPATSPGGGEWPRGPLLGGLAEARFALFKSGHDRRYSNFFLVEIPDGYCHIFDYRYTTGSGKSTNVHYYTVFMLYRSHWNLPSFTIEPQNLFHGIGKMFGMQDIDLGEYPAFSKRYLLRGADESAVRRVFENRALVQLFESRVKNPISVQASGDGVVLWLAKASQLNPRELTKGVQDARTFAEYLT